MLVAMRQRVLLGLLAVGASACSILFPLDDYEGSGGVGAAGASSAGGSAGVPASAYREAVLADGPVAYLRFGEKSGTVAKDEMGQHNGTYLSGVELGAPGAIEGDTDTAASFDGSLESRVEIPPSPSIDFPGMSPFTVEMWARQTRGTGYGFVIDHETYPNNRTGIGFLASVSGRAGVPDDMAMVRYEKASADALGTRRALARGTYQHVVGTFDGVNAALYIDGVKITDIFRLNVSPITTTWTIGGQNCNCAMDNFAGSIDEVAIYNKALDERRILAHFRAAGR